VSLYYGKLLDDPVLRPVSLHLMLSESNKSKTKMINQRSFPSPQWYDRVLLREFDHETTLFFVISDDANLAERFMTSFGETLNFIVLRENSVVALHIMSRCQHHILTSSTLSFWGWTSSLCVLHDSDTIGAYLDKNQPTGGRTILAPSFFSDHGRMMIPYPSWEVIEDPWQQHREL
jgi:hypothetical protein